MINKPEVTTSTIFSHLWNGVKPYKWPFLFYYLLAILESVVGIFIPLYYKDFFDIIQTNTDKHLISSQLISIIIIVLFLNLIVFVLGRMYIFMFNILETKIMSELKQKVFNYSIKHSYDFFVNNFTGALVQKINRIGQGFENIADTIMFNVIPIAVTIIGSIIISYNIAPFVAYIITAWVLIYMLFNIFYTRWHQKYNLAVAQNDSETTAHLSDSIANHLAILLFNKHKQEDNTFKNLTNIQAQKRSLSWNLREISNSIYLLLICLVEFFVFYYAINLWEKDLITVGTFVLIQAYILSIAHKLYGFNRAIRVFSEGIADAKEAIEILETPHNIKDTPLAQKLRVTNGQINLKNVTFNFNQTREVISNLNLQINTGEKVALVGYSGAGKTTLIRLILRLYELTSGEILIDNQNIAHVTQESLHNQISLVPQDPILFHRSILENIRYGKPEASIEEVIEASKQANCHEFIDKLSAKYDTIVGERGVKLSGGERQRVAIARALLKNAPILILDEATSSLDSYSEDLIQDALEKLMKNRTTIVIAHRLSTIKKMDRIITLNNGAVAEDGNHEELIKKNGIYANLWNLQVSGFIQE